MKKIIWAAIALLILIAWVFGYNYISSQELSESSTSSMSMEETSQKIYEHTFPEQVTKSDFFQGVFIQNDTAWVYPRREALVKDILVDIGDEVQEWQTLAILFEPWVSGQSDSNINLKSTLLTSQNKILADTKKVASAKISEFDAMIQEERKKVSEKKEILEKTIENIDSKVLDKRKIVEEKKDVLEETRKNFNSQILQTQNQYETQKEVLKNKLAVERNILETLQTSLENAKKTKAERLKESQNNIVQKEELLKTKIDEIYTQVVPLMYIWEEWNVSYEEISRWRLSDFFSAGDSQNISNLVSEVQKFQSGRDVLDTLSQYTLLRNVNKYLLIGLEKTITSVWDTDEVTIASYISLTKTYDTWLINQKEIYDDALSAYWVLETSENEKISNIEYKISEQESKIILESGNNDFITTDKSLEVIDSEKQLQLEKLQSEIEILQAELNTFSGSEKLLQIEKLQSEIDIWEVWIQTLIQSRKLLSANESKQITSAANSVAIAKADLNKEYIASNDSKIISSFSWVISKRDVEIGAMISPSMEAFRIAWVDNSLSRITKKEIQFYVPENLQDQIEMWQEVYFSASDEGKAFTGSIYRISPEIDPATRAITVQAKVDDSLTLSNKSSLRVTFTSETLTYKIPTSSIYNKDERKIMYYKKDNGKLGVQDITIISDDGEFSLISWDFDSTLKVVTTPIFVK